MNIKIIDCTIRDGGHLNKWKFDLSCVRACYAAARKSGVDYFEAGYRYTEETKDLGLFGYCTDETLRELSDNSEKCKLAVMIDAGKCHSSQFTRCLQEKTPLRVVRVAAYPYELDKAVNLVQDLFDKGYEIFLNLMASSELTKENYDFLHKWDNKNILSAVYFADSFGSFTPKEVSELIHKLEAVGFSTIGFHPHNSLQLAFANTLCAIENGVSFVDSSVYGMGRGSGNLPIEILLGYLERLGDQKYNTVPYLDVIERHFLGHFRNIGWGYSLKSLMSGLANVHPYYVDALYAKGTYTTDEIWNALSLIKERCPISFSENKLEKALGNRFFKPLTLERARIICGSLGDELHSIPSHDSCPAGMFPFEGRYKGRNFLILASGTSLATYTNQILQFSEKEDCILIGLNNLRHLFQPQFHVFVSRKRFLQYSANVAQTSTLLVPSFFGTELVEKNYSGEKCFFDVVAPCDAATDPVRGGVQHCLNLNVAISGILLAYQMGASTIFIAGMDGYADEFNKQIVYFYDEDNKIEDQETASYRYESLAQELDRVNSFLLDKEVELYIITPTSHKRFFKLFLTP